MAFPQSFLDELIEDIGDIRQRIEIVSPFSVSSTPYEA